MANEKNKQEGITKKLDVERRKTLVIQQRLENMSGQNYEKETSELA